MSAGNFTFYSPGPRRGYLLGGSRPMLPFLTLCPLIASNKVQNQWNNFRIKVFWSSSDPGERVLVGDHLINNLFDRFSWISKALLLNKGNLQIISSSEILVKNSCFPSPSFTSQKMRLLFLEEGKNPWAHWIKWSNLK